VVRKTLAASYATGRKIVVGVVGATVLLLGLALIVLPGPAVLVIPLGLGILAAEFSWARRWLARLREGGDRVLEGLRRRGAWER